MSKRKIFKNEPDHCPVCNGTNTYVYNMGICNSILKATCCCSDCEVVWDEWFALRYAGYSMDNINYDSNGNKEE